MTESYFIVVTKIVLSSGNKPHPADSESNISEITGKKYSSRKTQNMDYISHEQKKARVWHYFVTTMKFSFFSHVFLSMKEIYGKMLTKQWPNARSYEIYNAITAQSIIMASVLAAIIVFSLCEYGLQSQLHKYRQVSCSHRFEDQTDRV